MRFQTLLTRAAQVGAIALLPLAAIAQEAPAVDPAKVDAVVK